jgi:EAL domain-containing protein (putative c-di-GMP-specific phosphodiesterase class I)/GGDEF domain-containing protein
MRTKGHLTTELSFEANVRQAILATQHGPRQVGLLLISVERPELLELNSTLHDELLDKIWVRLRGTLRDSDPIFRIENGLMAALLPSIGGAEDAALVAKKILQKFAQPFRSGNAKIIVPLHIGASLFPEQSRNASDLIKHAGEALKTAKKSAERFAVYSSLFSLNESGLVRMGDLRQAIIDDQLFLMYQPKVRLANGSISGVEALVRWTHPKLGLVQPDEFIPVAERTGLIFPLTLWVLHRSLMQCRAWKRFGLDLRVAVNLSMLNLSAPELPEQITGLLRACEISPDKLELEITESAVMDDPSRALRTLNQIRNLGVRLAIDDFGTGYSSLAYLSRLPVTTIKIDKSFIRNLTTNRENAVIVKSIIDLAHNLELNVVAEGVETRATKELLVDFHCDEAQGYYIGRPVHSGDIEESLVTPPRAPRPQEPILSKEL